MATKILWSRALEAHGLAGSLNLSIAPIGSTGSISIYEEGKWFLKRQQALEDPPHHSLIRMNQPLDLHAWNLLQRNQTTIKILQHIRKAPYIMHTDHTGMTFHFPAGQGGVKSLTADAWAPHLSDAVDSHQINIPDASGSPNSSPAVFMCPDVLSLNPDTSKRFPMSPRSMWAVPPPHLPPQGLPAQPRILLMPVPTTPLGGFARATYL